MFLHSTRYVGRIASHLPFLLLISTSLILLYWFYGPVLLAPDSYVFNTDGDGLKNYFTYAHHVSNDTTYFNFSGFNYPYGEHIFFTDCHPLLANLVKYLASYIPFVGDHCIGILNFLLIFSIFLTAVVCYLLLVEIGVHRWSSILYAIGITALSPQLARIGCHQSLSYGFAIPLAWLLLLKSFKSNGAKTMYILLFFNNAVWLFTHAYLGIIVISFTSVVIVGKYIFDKGYGAKPFLCALSTIVFPVILFLSVAHVTDNHLGRPQRITGWFLYNAEIDDVFLPNHPPLRPLLDSITGNSISQEWEALGYVGLATTILTVLVVILGLLSLARRRTSPTLSVFFNSLDMNLSLSAAVILLLFAMTIPLKFFPGLLDLLPVLSQFRATGRFTWPFFFVATVFLAFVLQKLYDSTTTVPGKAIVILACVAASLANMFEGLPYHQETARAVVSSKNIFHQAMLDSTYTRALSRIKPLHYQALLPLPFYYHGSENLSRPRQSGAAQTSIIVSYHTGIPIISSNTTRSSIDEGRNIIQLLSPDFFEKKIKGDLISHKPILIVKSKEALTALENEVLKKSRPVYISDEISLYELDISELFRSSAPAVVDSFSRQKPRLAVRGTLLVSSGSSFVYHDGFDTSLSQRPLRGKGGFQSTKKGKNIMARFAPGTFKPGITYRASVWMFNGHENAINNWFRFIIEERDGQDNEVTTTVCFPDNSEVIDGNWSMADVAFQVSNPSNHITLYVKGKKDETNSFFADELLVREENINVYQLDSPSRSLYVNNLPVPLR